MRTGAILACLIAMACLLLSAFTLAQEATQPSRTEKSNTQDQRAAPSPIIVNVVPAPKTEEETEQERRERAEKSDLDRSLVQLTAELTKFTRWLAYATIALVIVTTGIALIGLKQASDMRESLRIANEAANAAKSTSEAALQSNQITRDLFVAEHRPWISMDIVPYSALRWDEVDLNLGINIILTNSGHTPATHVTTFTEFFLIGPDKPQILEYLRQKCMLTKNRFDPNPLIVLRDKPSKTFNHISLRTNEIRKAISDGNFSLWIVAWVHYRGIGSDGVRTRGAVYVVSASPGRVPLAVSPKRDEGQISIGEFEISSAYVGEIIT